MNQTLYTSYILMVFRLAVSSAKIIAILLVLLLSDLTAGAPLLVFVLFTLFLDLSYLVIQIARIPYIKRIRAGEDIQEPGLLSFSLKLQVFLYVTWQIPGNIWYWSCHSCYNEAAGLTVLTFALILLGYLYLLVPALLLVCICACLPVSIIFLMLVSNNYQEPAAENLIRELKTNQFSTDKHIGDFTCSICAADYEEGEAIVVLACDERHCFHEECIKRWLRINAICPICRAPFSSN